MTFTPTQSQRKSIFMFELLILFSLWPWFLYFFVSKYVLFSLEVIFSVLAYVFSPTSFQLTRRNLAIFLLLFLAALLGTSGNINAFYGTILRCIPFFVFMCAKSELRITTINVFNKIYCWILGVSLFFWILHLLGMPFPHTHLTLGDDSGYEFDNYFIFVRDTGLFVNEFFPRFCSIFLEPGYVACFIVLMLFINKFDFRKLPNLVYLASLIMTFSLAGWLFFFIALIPYVTQRGKMKWIYLVFVGIVVVSFIYFNNSNSYNAVNVLIGNRLKFENGEMVGYNRVNQELEYTWKNQFWKSDKILFGFRDDYYDLYNFGASVDSRAYIIRFGLLAMIAYVVFLVKCLRVNMSRFGLWFFIVVVLFVYRGYSIMFIDALLFIYVAGMEKLKNKNAMVK